MKIAVSKVKSISGKTLAVEVEDSLPVLPADQDRLKLLAPVKFFGAVENSGKTLVVKGTVSATVELPCSRCAEMVLFPLNMPFYETFSNQREYLGENGEEEIYFFEGDEIDITDQVVRSILLELPMKVLCQEGCRGICPGCGVNLNFTQCRCVPDDIDPRLLQLKKLLNESSTEGGVISGSTEKKNF